MDETVLALARQQLHDCTRDGQRLSRLLAEAEETIGALEAALHALVDEEVLGDTGYPWNGCVYCESHWAEDDRSRLVHQPDCPWVKARELLQSD